MPKFVSIHNHVKYVNHTRNMDLTLTSLAPEFQVAVFIDLDKLDETDYLSQTCKNLHGLFHYIENVSKEAL